MDIKSRTYYFFNIQNFDPNKIKIDEGSFKNIILYYIRYLTIENLTHIKIISVNLLYLIVDKINWFIEESNENKCLTPVPWNKIWDLIRSITNNSNNYDEK